MSCDGHTDVLPTPGVLKAWSAAQQHQPHPDLRGQTLRNEAQHAPRGILTPRSSPSTQASLGQGCGERVPQWQALGTPSCGPRSHPVPGREQEPWGRCPHVAPPQEGTRGISTSSANHFYSDRPQGENEAGQGGPCWEVPFRHTPCWVFRGSYSRCSRVCLPPRAGTTGQRAYLSHLCKAHLAQSTVPSDTLHPPAREAGR